MAHKPRLASQDNGSTSVSPGCDYTSEQLDWLKAIERYKRIRGPFPQWTGMLDLVHALGYRLTAPPDPTFFRRL